MGGFPNYPELHYGMTPRRGPRSFRQAPGMEETLHAPRFYNAAAGQLNPRTCRPRVRG